MVDSGELDGSWEPLFAEFFGFVVPDALIEQGVDLQDHAVELELTVFDFTGSFGDEEDRTLTDGASVFFEHFELDFGEKFDLVGDGLLAFSRFPGSFGVT